jgi:hypothetical protein
LNPKRLFRMIKAVSRRGAVRCYPNPQLLALVTCEMSSIRSTAEVNPKGVIMPGRVLFVCALGSGRALLAAGLLQAMDPDRWEAWSASPTTDRHDIALIEQVLHEQGRTPLSADRCVLPAGGMTWDEIILLCSGDTAT